MSMTLVIQEDCLCLVRSQSVSIRVLLQFSVLFLTDLFIYLFFISTQIIFTIRDRGISFTYNYASQSVKLPAAIRAVIPHSLNLNIRYTLNKLLIAVIITNSSSVCLFHLLQGISATTFSSQFFTISLSEYLFTYCKNILLSLTKNKPLKYIPLSLTRTAI